MIELVPSNVHPPVAFDIGDDWFIEFACTYRDGSPLDLTSGALVNWRLIKGEAEELISLSLGTGIELVEGANNKCLVHVPHMMTEVFAPGFYRDQLRVTIGDIITTQSKGRIEALVTY